MLTRGPRAPRLWRHRSLAPMAHDDEEALNDLCCWRLRNALLTASRHGAQGPVCGASSMIGAVALRFAAFEAGFVRLGRVQSGHICRDGDTVRDMATSRRGCDSR